MLGCYELRIRGHLHYDLTDGVLFLQCFERGDHFVKGEFLRDDGLEVVCGCEGGELGDGGATEARLTADWYISLVYVLARLGEGKGRQGENRRRTDLRSKQHTRDEFSWDRRVGC